MTAALNPKTWERPAESCGGCGADIGPSTAFVWHEEDDDCRSLRLPIEQVKKISEAQFAYCETCEQWLGSPYWPLSKSVALHKGGTGHKPTLWRLT